MASADKNKFDDQHLAEYLLGSLSDVERERLDELSVTEDELAWRLAAVENDLVDAYVRNELSGDTLERFQKFYLSSPRRAEKVQFARTLFFHFEKKEASAAAGAFPAPVGLDSEPGGHSWRRRFTVPSLNLQWGLAAATLILLFASGYLLVESERLRKQRTEASGQLAAMDQRARELQKELSEQRSTSAEMLKEMEKLRESVPTPGVWKTIAVLLSPETRGIGQVATVFVPQGTVTVTLRLQLESDDYPTYAVVLRDPGVNQAIWRSALLKSRPEGKAKAVSIRVPARILKQQNYLLELTGIPVSGRSEFVTSYAIRVVLE